MRSAARRPRAAVAAALFTLCATHAAAGAAGAWSPQRSGTFNWLRAIHFVDEQRGWAAGGKGNVLKTTDGGRRWETLPRPTEDLVRDVFFGDEETGWLLCESNLFAPDTEVRSYLLKTTDGGASWSRVLVTGDHPEALLVRVVFADQTHGWAFGEMGALFSTKDGGASWSPQRVPTQRLLLGATFFDASQGWLVGAGSTILQTADGGGRWSGAETSLPQPTRINAVSFADAGRGWAVGANGTVLATADGGRTWRLQRSGTGADLADVKFLDPREGWAVGAGGTIIHTTDGGASWEIVPSQTNHPLERLAFASRTRGWAVGFGGTIITYAPSNAIPPRMKN
ncbi:MAG TPA: YCF48-related protein [Pyrinomonadaceae bacterium]|nr:YCF48-related protein [Pyrinomonadaceae bacterium]